MKYIIPFLWAAVWLCLLASSACAQSDVGTDPGFLADLYRAMVHGQLGWCAGLALIAIIEPVKRLLRTRIAFFATKVGGTLLAFLMATVTGCAHALSAGAAWDLDLASAIFLNAVVAIGGYTAIKKTLVAQYPWLEKIIGAKLEPPKPAVAAVPSNFVRESV